MAFARRQYALYPALGIGIHHPPGLAIAEAGAFAVFGISMVVARAVILAFGVLCLVGLYLLLRKATTLAGALSGTSLMVCMPLIVKWGRETMLEMPTLAVLVWSAYLFLRYLDRPAKGRLILFLTVATMGPFFKQTAIFILPVFGLWALVRRKKMGIPTSHLVAAALTLVLIPGAYFYMIFARASFYTARVGGKSELPFMLQVATTFRVSVVGMAKGAGLVGLSLAIAGAIIAMFKQRSRVFFLACFWLVSFVLMWSLSHGPDLATREPRFLFFGIVPFAMFAGLGLGHLAEMLRPERVRVAIVTVLVLGMAMMGFARDVTVGPDYRPIVGVHTPRIHGNVVMFAGQRDSDFIFAVREIIGPQKAIILRSSKMLYDCAVGPEFSKSGYRELVSDMSDIEKVLDDFGVSAVFAVREDAHWAPPEKLLRAYLAQSTKYECIKATGGSRPGSAACPPIDVYVRRVPIVRKARYLEINLPTVGSVIKVDLDSLGVQDK